MIKNPPNKLLEEKNLLVSPDFTKAQKVAIVVFWILVFPICLPLWLISHVLLGTLIFSGTFVFAAARSVFGDSRKLPPEIRWQCARAFINNTVASRIPHVNSTFRRFLFRRTGIRIGRDSFVGMSGYMEDYLPQNVVLEDNVTVSFGVTFIAHGVKAGLSAEEKTIILRKGAYVGAASVLLPGIEIGSGAVVGAGSVVTRDVPAGAIVGGSPARVIKWKDGYGPNK